MQAILRHEKEFQAALHCNASLRFDNGYVYIEVPTGTETVFLGDMLIDNEYQSTDGFTMAIGMAVDVSIDEKESGTDALIYHRPKSNRV